MRFCYFTKMSDRETPSACCIHATLYYLWFFFLGSNFSRLRRLAELDESFEHGGLGIQNRRSSGSNHSYDGISNIDCSSGETG